MPALAASPARSSTQLAAPYPIRILADDLTGACDSAVAFLQAGHSARVWLTAVAVEAAEETVQAFNTASRDISRAHARKRVADAATSLLRHGPSLFFKKVDSVGRGHIATEVLAAHAVLGTSAVLFAPSFPATGRTVRGGILYIEDPSGTRDSLPLLPLFQNAAVAAQISQASQIPAAIAGGATVLVCDAATQSDFEALTSVEYPNLLYAGSAGLASAIASRSAVNSFAPASMPMIAQSLTVCGTSHRVTHLQLGHLLASHPQHPLLQIRAEAHDRPYIRAAFDQHRPDALLLTGGDTALLVLTTLGAHSILLRGELAPGIPWGLIQGGAAHGRVVITKSGGFGSVDILSNIVKGFP